MTWQNLSLVWKSAPSKKQNFLQLNWTVDRSKDHLLSPKVRLFGSDLLKRAVYSCDFGNDQTKKSRSPLGMKATWKYEEPYLSSIKYIRSTYLPPTNENNRLRSAFQQLTITPQGVTPINNITTDYLMY